MTQSMYGEHMDAYLEAIRGFLFFFLSVWQLLTDDGQPRGKFL